MRKSELEEELENGRLINFGNCKKYFAYTNLYIYWYFYIFTILFALSELIVCLSIRLRLVYTLS